MIQITDETIRSTSYLGEHKLLLEAFHDGVERLQNHLELPLSCFIETTVLKLLTSHQEKSLMFPNFAAAITTTTAAATTTTTNNNIIMNNNNSSTGSSSSIISEDQKKALITDVSELFVKAREVALEAREWAEDYVYHYPMPQEMRPPNIHDDDHEKTKLCTDFFDRYTQSFRDREKLAVLCGDILLFTKMAARHGIISLAVTRRPPPPSSS